MPPPIDIESLCREDRMILAVEALKSDALLSERRAAAVYQVLQKTLSD
jgi:hypothetical protein